MRKRIFLDANVLVDLINAANHTNSHSIYLFNQLRKNKELLYCSPVSFAITYYLWGKSIKNKRLLNKEIIEFFSDFQFTREDHLIMQKVKESRFRDLEDAVQYFSAEDADVNVIITKKIFDFEHSQIPVYHPLEYINQFLL